MKFRTKLIWMLVIVAGVGVWKSNVITNQSAILNSATGHLSKLGSTLDQQVATWRHKDEVAPPANWDQQSGSTQTSAQSKTSATSQSRHQATTSSGTPVLSIVEGQQLANTYYYHFDASVTPAVKQVFQKAVNTYNATGIVKLIAGSGSDDQNQIAFTTYNKTDGSNANTLELGEGGPQIIKQSYPSHTMNHATASLNLAYPEAISLSAAIHETGHALGLDHSQDKDSVMYPVDQGKTTLSSGDIAGLKAIYG